MSNFKVRFGWGVVGNDRITNYLSMDLYTDNKYGIGNNTVTVLTPKQLKNSDLKWEGSSTVNLGLDLGFFDNRLNLTADFFIKTPKTYYWHSHWRMPPDSVHNGKISENPEQGY